MLICNVQIFLLLLLEHTKTVLPALNHLFSKPNFTSNHFFKWTQPHLLQQVALFQHNVLIHIASKDWWHFRNLKNKYTVLKMLKTNYCTSNITRKCISSTKGFSLYYTYLNKLWTNRNKIKISKMNKSHDTKKDLSMCVIGIKHFLKILPKHNYKLLF